MSELVPELDIDQLDADLYTAWQALQKQNYGKATNLVAASWMEMRRFRMSLDDHAPATADPKDPRIQMGTIYYHPQRDSGNYVLHLEDGVCDRLVFANALRGIADNIDNCNLPATTDRNFKALLIKAVYWLRNLRRPPCYPEYNCEWAYPYGFVPEGGCPWHDRGGQNER